MKSARTEMLKGIILLTGFIAILIGLFSPIINGEKPINYFDNLYNSISKGSVYYIPGLLTEAEQLAEQQITAKIGFPAEVQAESMLEVYQNAGLQVEKNDNSFVISGILKNLLTTVLQDSDALFNNNGDQLSSKYGIDEREVVYIWWLTLKGVEKELNNAKRFEEAKFTNSILTRAVESAYNYYQIEPYNISDEVWFVIASLVFYVVYTLMFGYAIMFLFNGLGLKLEH